MGETSIQWCDYTWNPVRGCSRISPGCENCYAETMAARFSGEGQWAEGFATRSPARWTRKVQLVPEMLEMPLRWQKPRRIFVNSMSDLFHESLSNEAIAAVFGVMAAAPQHTFQILTKRSERLPEWFNWAARSTFDPADLCLAHAAERIEDHDLWQRALEDQDLGSIHTEAPPWPLPNVWLGVSVEDQQRADERIPHLLRTPAAVRFLSCEPLLGRTILTQGYEDGRPKIHWVIVGGESGHGARPMRLEWTRSIVDQCRAAGVPVFVKQLGAHPSTCSSECTCTEPEPYHLKLDRAHGGDMAEWPTDLRVREFPKAAR